jgi:hypothetical protein
VSAPLPGLKQRMVPAIGALLVSTWIVAAPLDTLRDCAAIASPGLSGIKQFAAACPDLPDALAALGLDDVLFDGWRERLSVFALRDLTGLTEQYSGPMRTAPSAAALPEILAALKQEQTPKPESLWNSLKSWWKQWLAKRDSALSRIMNRWLDEWTTLQPSMSLVRGIIYGLGVLIVAAALVVVLRELLAAGVLRRRAAEVVGRPRRVVPGASAAIESLRNSAADTPVELLRLLVKRLSQTGRLESEASLTHRELVARSVLDSDLQRAALAGVAWSAESILYGPKSAAREPWGAVVEKGRSLLAQLSDSTSSS